MYTQHVYPLPPLDGITLNVPEPPRLQARQDAVVVILKKLGALCVFAVRHDVVFFTNSVL
jgi:hypothetical protein